MESLRGKNRLGWRERAKLVALMALVAMSGAETASANGGGADERRHPVFKVADRLEKKIANRRAVRIEAERDVYWSRPTGRDDGRFDFRTEVPLAANVHGTERHFRLEQKGDSLDDIEVYPIPKRQGILQAESINSRTYHCDIPPNHRVEIELNRAKQPVAELEYGPAAAQEQTTVRVGHTSAYGRGVVLIPPVTPDNHGCDPFFLR